MDWILKLFSGENYAIFKFEFIQTVTDFLFHKTKLSHHACAGNESKVYLIVQNCHDVIGN